MGLSSGVLSTGEVLARLASTWLSFVPGHVGDCMDTVFRTG